MCNHVLPSTAVRDLGIIPMDNNVSMRSHASRTVSRCLAAEVEPVEIFVTELDRRRPVNLLLNRHLPATGAGQPDRFPSLFSCVMTAPQHQTLSDRLCVSVAGHVAGHATSRLWQRNTRWVSHDPAPSTSVGTQRLRQTDVFTFIHHRSRRNNETNKQAEKKKRKLN